MTTLLGEYELRSNATSAIGRCIIINNEHFQDPSIFKERRGTHFDELMLKETFLAIGFQVKLLFIQ